MSHEQINLGTEKDLKFVNLGTCCTPQERKHLSAFSSSTEMYSRGCMMNLKLMTHKLSSM